MCIVCMQCLCKTEERAKPLELKLQAMVSCTMWVLGVKPGAFVRAAKCF